MKHKLYNRLLSLALALGLVVGMLPGMTFAGAVDTTAPQSQAEQIAEPTEEPEANDTLQVEPRVNTQSFTVQFVDGNRDSIEQSDRIYSLSGTSAVTIQAIADSFGDISGYTFTNEAYIDRGWRGTINNIQQVRYRNSTLQYSTTNNSGWNTWPDNGWFGDGDPYPLVLVYEKNEEPEPTPTPDPTPDPGDRPSNSAGISIADNISTNGTLDVDCSIANVDHYVWYRGETWTEVGSAEGIDPQRVSGNEYNVDPGDDGREGDWLNAALDRQLMEDANPNLNDSMRYCYKVSAVDAEGNILGSAYYQVPYYFQLQNGSFENPVAGQDVGHKGKDNNYELGEYGYQPFYENDQYDSMVWKTTSEKTVGSSWNQKTYHLIEIVSGRTQPFRNNAEEFHKIPNGQMADGVQCAELNAEAAGSLYQDVMTAPGASLNWQLSHLGRDGSDTMYVLIMSTDLAKDIDTQEEVNDVIRDVQHNSGQRYPGARVWEITTSNQAWKTYTSEGTTDVNNQTGAYLVPNGQYLTRFFFVSGKTASGDNTVGNHLDDVSFGTDMPEPDVGKGNLEVVKTVTGVAGGDLPEDYSVTVHVDGQESKTINNFSYNSQTGVYTGTAQFLNIPEGSYTVTETVNNNLTVDGDGYEYDKDNSKTEVTVQVGDRENVTANLKNVYIEDTSDEYPVRFYLQDVNGNEMYNFEDNWGILPSYLQSGFANVATSETPASDYVTTNIQGHDAVQNWIKTNGYDPGINMNDVGTVLQNLINQGYITRGTQVATINGDSVTANEIINNSSDYSIVYVQATSNNDKLNKEGYKRGNVTYDNEGYPWQKSYHVHLSIRKNPGDLTITKTFDGLEDNQIPDDFTMTVKSKNGTVVGTLTLGNAEKTQNGVYTWTLENLNEDIYTVTEINTDVDNKALNATYTVQVAGGNSTSGTGTTAQVNVSDNKMSTVAFTNTYTDAEGVLKITKVITGSSFNDGRDVFNFKITKTDDPGKDTVYYVTIQGAGEANITLPAGTYKVEELDNLNYELTGIDGEQTNLSEGFIKVTVGGGETTVTFTNNADPTDIPSDSGATQNNPDWQDDGDLVWKHDEGDDAIVSNPEKPGEKPPEN